MFQSPGTRSRFVENEYVYKGGPGRGSLVASERMNSPKEHIARAMEQEGYSSNPPCASEEESDKAADEIKKMKTTSRDTNSRPEVSLELDSIKKALSTAKQELKIKEKTIFYSRSESERASLKKTSTPRATTYFKEARIRELEQELDRKAESETKLLDSLLTQTKQLEQTKISLEESRLVISSVTEKIKKTSFLDGHGTNPEMFPMDNEVDKLKYELWLVKENLAHAEDTERVASSKVKTLVNELNSAETKLKTVCEAEEHCKKAMDELAFALKEVATEANDVKTQLASTKRELEKSKSDEAQSKSLLKSMESRFRTFLEEARAETEKHRNSSERLRLEAEESQIAWHEKETMFVECIRNAEGGNEVLEKEVEKLTYALASAKEENKKLRDILKQALIESNVAKEAATIAREENSQLKDSVCEKESALEILSQEVENLRMSEALAHDNVKEYEPCQRGFKTQYAIEIKKPMRDQKSTGKALVSNDRKDKRNEGQEGDEMLPNRKKSMSFSYAGDVSKNSRDCEPAEEDEESENEKNERKRKTLLKRFGSMLSRKSFHRRDTNVE